MADFDWSSAKLTNPAPPEFDWASAKKVGLDTPPEGTADVSDYAKSFGAGAVSGTGQLLHGIGEVGRLGATPIVAGINALGGDLSAPVNPVDASGITKGITGFSDSISDSMSPQAKAIQAGEPGHGLARFGLGAANMVGNFVPAAASLAIAPEAEVPNLVSTGAVFGAQGGGAASLDEAQRVRNLSDDDLSKLPGYQQRIQSGMNPDQAKEDLATNTGQNAFNSTAPVAALSALAFAGPIQRSLAKRLTNTASKFLPAGVASAVGTGVADAGLQGAVGAGQTAAEVAGANTSTGETQSPWLNAGESALGMGALGLVAGLTHSALKGRADALKQAKADALKQAQAENQVLPSVEPSAGPITDALKSAPEAAAQTAPVPEKVSAENAAPPENQVLPSVESSPAQEAPPSPLNPPIAADALKSQAATDQPATVASNPPAESTTQTPARTSILQQYKDRQTQIDQLNDQRKSGDITPEDSEKLHDLRDQQDLTNPVSGLPNKKAFDQAMASGEYSHAAALDVDEFKKVNDTLGHGVGDLVLQHIGQQLADNSNGDILFAHLSGDEYAAAAKTNPSDSLAQLQDKLDKQPFVIKYDDTNGNPVEHQFNGIGMTFGVGEDYKGADNAANQSKSDRAAAGLRQSRESDGAFRRVVPAPEGSDIDGGISTSGAAEPERETTLFQSKPQPIQSSETPVIPAPNQTP